MCQSILRQPLPHLSTGGIKMKQKKSIKIFSLVMAAILLITTVAGVIASVVS